jgi:ribonuclease BN (tRNA processing enzyme)
LGRVPLARRKAIEAAIGAHTGPLRARFKFGRVYVAGVGSTPNRLTVLGSSGAWPESGRACSGFLIESDGATLVLDLGFGTLPRLLKYCRAQDLRAVFISHAHADHCVDLYGLYRALKLPTPPFPSPPVYASAEVVERVGALDGAGGPERLRQSLDFRPLEGGQETTVGPFRLRTFALPHFTPNLGVRVEVDGAAIAYTGDTGPSELVPELAREADLFVCDSTHPTPPYSTGPRLLLSAAEAGEYARQAHARRLLLTHLWPGSDRALALMNAKKSFDGDVRVAEEALTIDID